MDISLGLLQNCWHGLAQGEIQQFGGWSYLLLARLVAVEGPIVTLLGAVAASTGLLRPGLVFLAASAGNLTADALWYSLGYMGQVEWLKRFGGWVGVRPEYISWLEQNMQTHAVKILFVAKLTLSLALPALIAAGLSRIPWRRWFSTIFAAECIWTGGLVLIGYYLSQFVQQLERGAQIAAIAILIIAVIFGFRYVKRHGPQIEKRILTNEPFDKSL